MGKQVKKHGYSCKLVRVVDGDTCDAMIDLGFNVWVKNRIRFMGVDAWESRTRNKEEKVKGLAAKAYVKDLLENSDDGKFSIISHGVGKYGRVLGELFVKGEEKSVNELLKENGHAYEYDGGKKRVEDELEEYLSLDMFERFGGGIGVTRMVAAMKSHGLLEGK